MEQITLSEKVKNALNRSREDARRMGHGFIAPEHIVMSMAEDPESSASRVLEQLGLAPAEVVEAMMGILRGRRRQPFCGGRSAHEINGKNNAFSKIGGRVDELPHHTHSPSAAGSLARE